MDERIYLISGASGLIGTALTESLRADGADVRRLVRRSPNGPEEFEWDPYEGYLDDRALDDVDVVVNLSGAGIGDKRWTNARKKVIYDSRIKTTALLAHKIKEHEAPPSVFVSQSAIGIYGDRGDEVMTEESSRGPAGDFLSSLVADWEAAAREAADSGTRVAHPRTGLVLSEGADLIERLTPIFRLGLGGPLGPGDQWWSWIDIVDVISGMRHAIDTEIEGPFNLVSPSPVRQSRFAEVLASLLHRPSMVPVPSIALKLALGPEKAEAIGLTSTRAVPEKLIRSGYDFEFESLESSLARILDPAEG